MKRLLVVVALGLAACQSMAPPDLPHPPQRIYQSAYSFMPPAELGWRVHERKGNLLRIVRLGINADETFAIQGLLYPLPPYGSRDEFFAIVRKSAEGDATHPRFKILRHDMIEEAAKDATCMRTHFVAEDSAAPKRTATPGVLVLETMVRYCVHPKKQGILVSLGYFHRRYPEHADAGFAAKADRVLSSLEYLE